MKIWVTSFVARLWQGMAGYGRVLAGWAQKLGRLLLFMTLALRQQWRTGYIGISQKDTERKAKSMTNPVHMRHVLPQTLVISVPGHRMHLDFTPQFQGVAGKSIMSMSSQSQGAACQAGDKRVSTKETCGVVQLSVWKNGAACSPTT